MIKSIDELWREFLTKFTEDYVANMSLEDYVVGHGNRESFCYYIEYALNDLGVIHSSKSSEMHGVFYSKKYGNYKVDTKKYNSSNVGEVFNRIKKDIVNIIKTTKQLKVYREIESGLMPIVKHKIMFLYNPQIMIPINSEKKCFDVCEYLKLPECKTYEDCQKQLFYYKKTHYPEYSNQGFMRVIMDQYKNKQANHEQLLSNQKKEEQEADNFISAVNNKAVECLFDSTKLSHNMPLYAGAGEQHKSTKFGGTTLSGIKKFVSGKKAENYFISFLKNKKFSDQEFEDVANNKNYQYDVKIGDIGIEIKNIGSGSFYLTETEINLLKDKLTRLVFVSKEDGIWLVKKDSKWLNETLIKIDKLRRYVQDYYSDFSLPNINIHINIDTYNECVDLTNYDNKQDIIKLLQ